jgi:UrcA family protein
MLFRAGLVGGTSTAPANTPHVQQEMEMNRNTTTIAAARATAICLAATLACSAAHASPGSLDESVAGASLKYAVPASDLDLSKIEGATVLYARIRHAARAVCETILTQQPGLLEKYRTCTDRAIAEAVARVNRPLLSQYHQLRLMGDRAALAQLAKGH